MGIYRIFQNLANEKFSQSQISGTDFEDIFEQKLIDEGYPKLSFKIDTSDKEKILSSESTILNQSVHFGYFRNPFGTQSPPDFLVYDKKVVLPIDLKTSNKDTPMWNNSLPKQLAIYVYMGHSFTSSIREIVYFRGCDVITKEASDIFKQRIILAQEESKFAREELANLDTFNHGWNIYIRGNYAQSLHVKSQTFTSFLNHPNKELNKAKVLEYLKSFEPEDESAKM